MVRGLAAAPRALIVDDEPHWQANTALQLEHAGFAVEVASTLFQGEDRAMALLDLQASEPILIVLDLVFSDAGPLAEGSILAHALIRRMGLGEIRRGLIVALSNALTPEREDVVISAGCDTVLPKPLTPSGATYLRANVTRPIVLPFENPHLTQPHARALRAAQYFAEQALADLRARRSDIPLRYGSQEIALILHAVTSYKLPDSVNADDNAQRQLITALGGSERVRDRLRTFAMQAEEPYKSITFALLNRTAIRDIGHSKIRRGQGNPFDRSYIYRCLQNLPNQLVATLQPTGLEPSTPSDASQQAFR